MTVSRSQMFATILAQDVNPDLYILIGGNLNGLSGYIQDAWQGVVASMTLWEQAEQEGAQSAQEKFLQAARHLRIPVSKEAVERRIQVMLEATLPNLTAEEHEQIREAEDSKQLSSLLQPQGSKATEVLPFIKALRKRWSSR